MLGSIAFGLFGLTVLISVAYAFSGHKRSVDWRQIAAGVGLQIVFAVIVILVPGGREFFDAISRVFVKMLDFAMVGAQFIFGDLARTSEVGLIIAFQVLPTIIFFASLMGVLYHIGLMQKIVQGMAWVMLKVLRVSGSESLSVAANVFIGQTEAPLVVRPYIAKMTESELFAMMVGGMATIAGAVMAAYIAMLGGADEAQRLFYARHLLAASVMAAPATIVIAKLLRPETGESLTRGTVRLQTEKTATNVIEAAANGAADGVRLALNVGGMLLAFIALIAMIDFPLAWFGQVMGIESLIGQPLSLSIILGYLLAPLAWIIGVPWGEATVVGGLIGEKIVINEFVAYLHLGEIKHTLSEHSILISTYALCGFANFGSLGIMIGGLATMVPERRVEVIQLGMKSIAAGTLATCMTGAVIGVLS